MKRLIIGALIGAISMPSFALRCNGKLVYDNDSQYTVEQKCGEAQNISGDIWQDRKVMTYDQGHGATSTVEILNGRVVNIDENRNL